MIVKIHWQDRSRLATIGGLMERNLINRLKILYKMTLKESFAKLAIKIQEDLKNISWSKAIIKIMRLEGTARFEGEYFNECEDKGKKIDVNFNFWEARAVHNIYKITTTEPPIVANWNRAIFTLTSDNKFEMEYNWDQELQDQVDGYNKGTKPIT